MCRCFSTRSNGAPAGAAAVSVLESAEFDLRDQGNVTLANGPQVLRDTTGRAVTFVVGGTAAAATWELQTGVGLVMAANATNGVFDSSGQTAPNLYVQASSLFAAYNIDASTDVMMRARTTVLTFGTANVQPGGFSVGVLALAGAPPSSSNRYRGLRRGLLAVTQGVSNIADAAAGSAIATVGWDIFGILNAPAAVQSLLGIWSTSWDDSPMVDELSAQDSASNNTQAYRLGSVRYALGFASRNASADMAVTVERVRFDFRRAWRRAA